MPYVNEKTWTESSSAWFNSTRLHPYTKKGNVYRKINGMIKKKDKVGSSSTWILLNDLYSLDKISAKCTEIRERIF